MLTRKQRWRRTRPPAARTHDIYSYQDSVIGGDTTNIAHYPNRAQLPNNSHSPFSTRDSSLSDLNSVPSRSHCDSPFTQLSSHSRDSFTLSEIDIPPTELNAAQKTVSFCSTVRVCLVPSRKCLAPFSEELFWSPDDYKTFKNEAINEIRFVLDTRNKDGNSCTPREAKHVLYQPGSPDRVSIVEDNEIMGNEENCFAKTAKFRFPSLEADLKVEVISPIKKREPPLSIHQIREEAAEIKQDISWIQPATFSEDIPEDEYQQQQQQPPPIVTDELPLRIMRRVDSVQLFKQQNQALVSSLPSHRDDTKIHSASPRWRIRRDSNSGGSGNNGVINNNNSTNSSNSNGGRRQLDLTVIAAVLA